MEAAMTYKTIMTILREPAAVPRLIPSAAALARDFDAHLEVLCVGIDEVQLGYYFAGADAVVQQTTLEHARKRAEETADAAEAACAKEGIRWDVRGVVAQFGAVGELVAETARFSDLVILSAPYASEGGTEDEAILEAALFTGQSPVLVLPETGLPADFGARSVIGWNEGTEALSAVRAALPLLQRAEVCSIAVIDPQPRSPGRAEPGRSLSTMLDRHGVTAEIALLPKTRPRVADVLAEHVADTGASLLVTGAYGHSRFRQAILGGATRDLLGGSGVPVLMAH
jgi:nucleotide-binding universal stress UspA family protein